MNNLTNFCSHFKINSNEDTQDFQVARYDGMIDCYLSLIKSVYSYKKETITINKMTAFLSLFKKQLKLNKEIKQGKVDSYKSRDYLEGYYFGVNYVIADLYSELFMQKYGEKQSDLPCTDIIRILYGQKEIAKQERVKYISRN
jgi:hypothetical protein